MTCIYKYIESDIDNMKFNKWGWVLKSNKKLKEIKQLLRDGHSYTIFDEKPLAILSFFEYDKDRYYGFIIADEKFKPAMYETATAIKDLSKSIGIPSGLKELGAKIEDLDILAANALKDACGLTNPIVATHDDIVQIIKNAF